jgi:hypothetical protein
MTQEMFRRWFESYVRRQEQRDATVVRELFAETGVYWWGPFYPPRHGVEAIYEHHRNALSHQTDIKYEYTIVATTKKYGVARFQLTLNEQMPGEPNTYDGVFVVHLNDEGKCTLFEEWYHSTTR